MCDHKTEADAQTYSDNKLSRRHFGSLAGAIGLTVTFAGCTGGTVTKSDVESAAKSVMGNESSALIKSDVVVSTPDGNCDAYFTHPATGKYPGIIVWTDIRGLRPAFKMMGERLAAAGYAVLTVNPFYREVNAADMAAKIASLPQNEVRPYIFGLAGNTDAETNLIDAKAFIDWLDQQASVDLSKKIGVTGYCYGGPVTMRVATAFPDRVGAGGSFHGVRLATDQPDSPHLGVPQMKADFLIAIATNDDEKEPEAKNILRKAFNNAPNSTAEIEVYPAAHGWCPPDSHAYDEVQAERAWGRMLDIFGKALA